MSAFFLDLETTGTDPLKDRIVQIAFAIGDHEPRKRLVNPEMPIPPAATEIQGITDEMVSDAPTFRQASRSLLEHISGCDELTGYNIIHFDLPLLSEEFARVGITWPDPSQPMPRVVDVFDLYRKFCPRKLADAVREFCGREQTAAHDAAGDVLDCRDVLDAMKRREEWATIAQEEDQPRVDVAGKLTRDAEGFLVYAFGKNKGARVADDLSYARWMLKSEFASNTKACLRLEIDRIVRSAAA